MSEYEWVIYNGNVKSRTLPIEVHFEIKLLSKDRTIGIFKAYIHEQTPEYIDYYVSDETIVRPINNLDIIGWRRLYGC